jgi:hypothetical protein
MMQLTMSSKPILSVEMDSNQVISSSTLKGTEGPKSAPQFTLCMELTCHNPPSTLYIYLQCVPPDNQSSLPFTSLFHTEGLKLTLQSTSCIEPTCHTSPSILHTYPPHLSPVHQSSLPSTSLSLISHVEPWPSTALHLQVNPCHPHNLHTSSVLT